MTILYIIFYMEVSSQIVKPIPSHCISYYSNTSVFSPKHSVLYYFNNAFFMPKN